MTKINIKKKIWLACPSGLRGHVKAVMYSYAWVQTPQPTIKKYYSSDVAQRLACRAHNAKVGGSIPPVAIYGSSQQFYHRILSRWSQVRFLAPVKTGVTQW